MIRLACLLLIAAACGGDDVAGTDGGVDALPGACDADAALHARFVIVGGAGASGPMGRQVGGEYRSHPTPELVATLAESGGCRFVGPSPVLCEPACVDDEVCAGDGRCVRFPDNLAAGTLTVTGTTPPVTLEPRPGNWYYPDTGYPDLYRPGDPITLALEGAAGVEPLRADVRGVPAITLPTTALTATEHQDFVIAWNAVSEPAGAEVMVHLDSDHHGIEAYVECVAPAAAGSLTVPAAILDRLILAGETGIGTYIENVWIELRHRARVPTARGCAAVDAYSADFLYVETVRAR